MMGYTAQEAGLALMPGGFVIMLAMPLVGYSARPIRRPHLLLFGLPVFVFSCFT